MGLDLEIRNACHAFWAGRRFMKRRTALLKLGDGGHVKIADVLASGLFFSFGENVSTKITTVEFFSIFMRPIKKSFTQDNCSVYVASFDDESNKSKRKAKTMAKRVENAKKFKPDLVPYDSSLVLTTDGLYDTETKLTEKLDLDRFRISKSFRPALMTLFQEFLQRENFMRSDQLLILEFSKDGPVFFPSIDNWPKDVPMPIDFARHSHSESDPSLSWCARVFRNKPVVVVGVDTDLIAIFFISLGALKNTSDRNPLLLWFPKDSSEEVIDLNGLVDDVLSATQLTAEQFALYCIFCGSDYVDKGIYAKGFGCLPILYALRRSKKELQHLVDICKKTKYKGDEVDSNAIEEAFVPVSRIIRKLYESGRKLENTNAMKGLRAFTYDYLTLKKGKINETNSSSSKIITNDLDTSSKRKIPNQGNNSSEINKDDMILEKTKTKVSNRIEIDDIESSSSDEEDPKEEEEYSYCDRNIMSFETIRMKYASSKSFKIPNDTDVRKSVESIIWNYIFWQNQAVPLLN